MGGLTKDELLDLLDDVAGALDADDVGSARELLGLDGDPRSLDEDDLDDLDDVDDEDDDLDDDDEDDLGDTDEEDA